MEKKEELKTDIFIFFFILALFSVFCIIYPILPNWDWYNYRAYNCWAFLNDRLSVDFLVSNLRTCINPIINLPEYFLMLKIKNYYLSTIIANIDISLLMFFVYKIIRFIFDKKNKLFSVILSLYCVVFIIASPLVLQMAPIGGHCDVKTALLCIAGFYCLIKNVFNDENKKRNIFIFTGGCLFGAATGLKYTAFVYFLTITLMFIILYKKIPRPIYSLFLFLSGGALSFFLTGGIWMIYCYRIYHNPLFPYFNNIFHSEYADYNDVITQDFNHMLPKNIFEYIFYAFQISYKDKVTFGNDSFAVDLRWASAYICIIIIGLRIFYEKIKLKCSEKSDFCRFINYNHLYFILLFIILSYFINTAIFGTYRYIFADYCLFGITIYLSAESLFYNFGLKKFLAPLFCVLILLTVYLKSEYGYIDNVDKYISVKESSKQPVFKNKDLNFKDGSRVLVWGNAASLAVAEQNKKAKYTGFIIPNYYLNENENNIKESDISIGSQIIYSEYLSELNKQLILSDEFIQILYSEREEIMFEILEEYNSQRKVKRNLTNCTPAGISFYGVSEGFIDIIRCDYN